MPVMEGLLKGGEWQNKAALPVFELAGKREVLMPKANRRSPIPVV
jgi:hypothetical protein